MGCDYCSAGVAVSWMVAGPIDLAGLVGKGGGVGVA